MTGRKNIWVVEGSVECRQMLRQGYEPVRYGMRDGIERVLMTKLTQSAASSRWESQNEVARGDMVVYRPLRDLGECSGVVVLPRGKSMADISVDTGSNVPLELTHIKVVPRNQLKPGTCARIAPAESP